jgi:gamma-glutamyltranspeptidase/glutathione hydrolase
MRDFHRPGRSAVYADNGMCATSHPLAARLAIDVLQSGGNAVDAAIAGSVLLGLCEPAMTGLGGDCFALVKPAGSEDVIALNGSGRAPAALSAETIRAAGHTHMPLFGAPEPITIPGAVDAFCRLSEDHGRLGLDAVLAPVIASGRGAAPHRPATAAARFYEGEVAEDMVAAFGEGGVHTLEDFAGTRSTYAEPVGPLQGRRGGRASAERAGRDGALMLNILSHFDIARMDPWGAERAHIEAEATKLAYDARNRLIADPDHMTRLEHMLSPETAARWPR